MARDIERQEQETSDNHVQENRGKDMHANIETGGKDVL